MDHNTIESDRHLVRSPTVISTVLLEILTREGDMAGSREDQIYGPEGLVGAFRMVVPDCDGLVVISRHNVEQAPWERLITSIMDGFLRGTSGELDTPIC